MYPLLPPRDPGFCEYHARSQAPLVAQFCERAWTPFSMFEHKCSADVSYTKCIIMKVVHFNFRRFFSCFSILFNFIKRILFRSRQRKSSRSEDDVLPTLVTVASDPQVDHDQVGNFSVLVLPLSTLLQFTSIC